MTERLSLSEKKPSTGGKFRFGGQREVNKKLEKLYNLAGTQQVPVPPWSIGNNGA